MQPISEVLADVRDLYQKVTGSPAPEIPPGAYFAFPPGVDPLKHAAQEAIRLKELTERLSTEARAVAWIPAADAFASEDAFVVRLEIPGVAREDVEVLVEGHECVVRGERKPPYLDKDLRPLSVERACGPFERRFALPPDSRAENVTAHYEGGELEVRVALERTVPSESKNVKVS